MAPQARILNPNAPRVDIPTGADVRFRATAAKSRQSAGQTALEDTLRSSRGLVLSGMQAAASPQATPTSILARSCHRRSLSSAGLGASASAGELHAKHSLDGRARQSVRFSEEVEPKYAGQKADELTKWMNADRLARHKDESIFHVPAQRQALMRRTGHSLARKRISEDTHKRRVAISMSVLADASARY